jgi:hypothetical protein
MIGSEVINMIMTLEQYKHRIQRESQKKGVVSKFIFTESQAWCSGAGPHTNSKQCC